MRGWQRKENNVRQLAISHFDYIGRVLEAHGEDENTIDKIRFHYIEAFVHGYKHSMEDWEMA